MQPARGQLKTFQGFSPDYRSEHGYRGHSVYAGDDGEHFEEFRRNNGYHYRSTNYHPCSQLGPYKLHASVSVSHPDLTGNPITNPRPRSENPRYYLSAMVCSCNDGHTYETIATPGILGACGFSTPPGPFLSTMPIVTPAPTPENPSFTTTFAAQPVPTTTAVADTDDGGDSGTGSPVLDAAGDVINGATDAAGDIVGGVADTIGGVADAAGDVLGGILG